MARRAAWSPLVGRARELAMLREHLASGGQDQGGLVLVAGEPGIGKTRLVVEFAEQARAAGWRVLTGRAYPSEGVPPYLPFIEAIREFLLTCPLADLRTVLGRGAQDVARLVPEVRDYLPELPERRPESLEVERYRLFESVTAFLCTIARARAPAGLLIVLEDLHWADSATLLLLLHLVRQRAGAPLLVAGTYRTTEFDRADPLAAVLADVRQEGLDERLRLAALTAEEVAALVERLTGRTAAPEVLDAISHKTEGNPFFVGEVVRHLLAEGRDLTDPHATVGQWGIPEGVREVIGRRLTRLGAPTHLLLQAAALQDDDLSPELLAAITELEPDALADAIEEAVAAGMLRGSPSGYQFTHALIRETLYDELSLPRRQRLHLCAAEAIERLHARNLTRYLATLARHYRLAAATASAGKAQDYALRAAEAAHAVFAWEEEAGHLQAALALAAEDERQLRCDLLLAVGEALRAAGQPLRVVEEAAPAAYTLAEMLGDGVRAIRACAIATQALLAYGSGAITGARRFREWAERAGRWTAPGTPERVHADLMRVYALYGSARFREAGALIPPLLAQVRRHSGPVEQCEVIGLVLALSPSPAREAHYLQLADEHSGEPYPGVPVNLAGWLLYYAGFIHLDWGARERAEDAWHRLAELAARTREPVVHFFSIRAGLIQALLGGDLAGALALGDELARRGREQGSPVLAWFHSSNLAYRPLLHLGRADDALGPAVIPAEARALGLTEVAPSLGTPEALCLAHAGCYAEARRELRRWMVDRHLGDVEAETPTAALAQFLEAAVLAEDREMAALLAERLAGVAFLGVGTVALTCIARHLGAAAALLGRWDEAYHYYQQALDVTARIGFRPEGALTRLHLAELLLTRDRDRRAEALDHLDVAIGEFQAMGMKPALERAQRLRERAGTRAGGGAPAYPDGLTEREVDVLRLLAAGKSNREISAALVLSVRTVERHIENIYVKTGMHNRTRATLYAQSHQLL